MTANPNPKGGETKKMDSSSLRSTLEEENYSSAPESPAPTENNHNQQQQQEKENKSQSPLNSQSKAIIPTDRSSHIHGSSPPQRSPKESPPPEFQQPQHRNNNNNNNNNVGVKPPGSPPVVVVNRLMRDELSVVTKVDPGVVTRDGHVAAEKDGVGRERGRDRRSRAVASILMSSRRDAMVKKAALGIRLCEVVFCLVSFSVMGADKTKGWAGDSFDRYKQYKYCITVNIIGFVYAGFQACDLGYHLVTAKHVIRHPLRFHLEFAFDQMFTYLLISASSSAATMVDDWVSNWGKDVFTEMASASIAMSFLAFFAFAISSLISGYHLCIRNFT